MVSGLVAGRLTRMLVDTGSGVTIVVWKQSQPKHRGPLSSPFRLVVAGGRAVNFRSQHDYGQSIPVCHETFSDTTVIPVNCQMQLPATISRGTLVGDAMLEPEATFTERHGVVVARSLIRDISEDKQLINPTPAPVEALC